MSAEPPPLLLVVDDDPVNLEVLCELLQAMEYRVEGALSGPAALAAARERSPDLILLDVMMPGMNGFEVCRRLRAEPATAQTPVVFVTALSDTEDKLRAIEAGADDFLTKPFNRPVLLARIQALLRLKAVREELEKSYRKLQELEQLREDLMKMIVHDLKSPLTSVLASLELVTDGDLGSLPPAQRRLLEDAYARGQDMLALMNDLLELARLEESQLQLQLAPVRVDELLRTVGEEWTVRAELEGATLATGSAPPVWLPADEHLLRRVFANLIGNALRHGGAGVRVCVSAELAPDGEGVCFTVGDNGPGIPETYHGLIFRKYGSVQTPSGSVRSSGLGLPFCKLAVEAHGGRIWVQSGTQGGTAFRFTLPMQPPSPVERSA